MRIGFEIKRGHEVSRKRQSGIPGAGRIARNWRPKRQFYREIVEQPNRVSGCPFAKSFRVEPPKQELLIGVRVDLAGDTHDVQQGIETA